MGNKTTVNLQVNLLVLFKIVIISRYDMVSSLFKTTCHSENNSRDFTFCITPSIAALHVRRNNAKSVMMHGRLQV